MAEILTIQREPCDRERFWRQIQEIRKSLESRRFPDSAELIREDRER